MGELCPGGAGAIPSAGALPAPAPAPPAPALLPLHTLLMSSPSGVWYAAVVIASPEPSLRSTTVWMSPLPKVVPPTMVARPLSFSAPASTWQWRRRAAGGGRRAAAGGRRAAGWGLYGSVYSLARINELPRR